jgi:surfactin synthase thioesterase subunit
MVTLGLLSDDNARSSLYAAEAASVPLLFARQARQRPDAIAVSYDRIRDVTQDAPSLPISKSALRGTQDSVVSMEETALWASAISNEFSSIKIPGNYMYFAKDWLPLASHIDQIANMAPSPACDGARS